MSAYQKKVIKKFHNYLNYDNVNGPDVVVPEEAKDSDVKMKDESID